MTIVFLILVILACAILGFIILVQNPKGGGLSGNIAGFSNQFMGVKQTTDVLERGTWIFASLIGVLCILSVLFLNKSGNGSDSRMENIKPTSTQNTTAPAPAPAQKP